jgi:ADP-ribose pyrophosphatase
MPGFVRLGSRLVARTGFLVLRRDYLLTPEGEWTVREVVRHPRSVVAVPWDGSSVAMVRQYRHAAGRPLLELPAGKLDVTGESPEASARRECIEEVGLDPARLTRVQGCFLSPGFTDEFSHIYLAEDLTAVPADPQGLEEQRAEVVRLAPEEVRDGLRTGAFEDATTIIGLYALLDHISS